MPTAKDDSVAVEPLWVVWREAQVQAKHAHDFGEPHRRARVSAACLLHHIGAQETHAICHALDDGNIFWLDRYS